MIEPIVQDYINAAIKMNLTAFCKQVGAPVLITAVPTLDQSFQAAPTRMLTDDEQGTPVSKLAKLNNKAKVMEIRALSPHPSGQVSLGRSEDNDLVLQDETVSSNHAIFMPDPKTGKPTIQDQESTNGSRINERMVVPWRFTPLLEGDVLSFGDAVYLFYTPQGLYKALRELFKSGGASVPG